VKSFTIFASHKLLFSVTKAMRKEGWLLARVVGR